MKSNAEWSDRSSLSAMVTFKRFRPLAFPNGSSNNIYQIEDLGKPSRGYDACYMVSRSGNPAGGHAHITSTQNCIVHTLYGTLPSTPVSCSAKLIQTCNRGSSQINLPRILIVLAAGVDTQTVYSDAHLMLTGLSEQVVGQSIVSSFLTPTTRSDVTKIQYNARPCLYNMALELFGYLHPTSILNLTQSL